MKMRTLFLVCSLMALPYAVQASGPSSSAQKKAISKWSCQEFLDLQNSYKPYAIGWAAALAKTGKPKDAVFDVVGVDTITPYVITVCQKSPKESFWQKVKEKISLLESDIKKKL